MKNLLEDISVISRIMTTGNSSSIINHDYGEVIIRLGITGDKEKKYTNGFGLKHIIARRSIDGKSEEEIAAILSLIPTTLREGKLIRDMPRVMPAGIDEGRFELEKNGIIAIIRKTWDETKEKWLLTGFDNWENKESSDAIRTVIAHYSYTPAFSYFRKQVGAELLIEQGIEPTLNKTIQPQLQKVNKDFSRER